MEEREEGRIRLEQERLEQEKLDLRESRRKFEEWKLGFVSFLSIQILLLNTSIHFSKSYVPKLSYFGKKLGQFAENSSWTQNKAREILFFRAI